MPNVFDQFDAPVASGNPFDQFSNGQPAATPTTGPLQQLIVDFKNQGAAAAQGTTPITSAQAPNLISDQVFQDELGNANYLDPKTGKVIPTDSANQVILTDPTDNKLKVYARSSDTNEGKLAGLGRIIGPGVVTIPAGVAAEGTQAAAQTVPALTAGEKVAAAGQRVGVDMPLAATTDSLALQNVGRKLTDYTLVGTDLEKASKNAVSQIGQAFTNVEKGYGSGSVPRAGEMAREGITDYIKGVSKEAVEKQYTKVGELLDPTVTVELPKTLDVSNAINGERSAAALKPSGAVALVNDAVTRPEGLTYEGIKKLRTSIGEMIDTGVLPADTSGAELKRIYGTLTSDLRNTVETAGGPKALAQWERANRYASLVAKRRENLSRILGAKNDEGIVDRIVAAAGSTSRADSKLLNQAKKAVGSDTWGELASAAISRAGKGADGQFSPEVFGTWWNKKLSARGKELLFRSPGREYLSKALDDIVSITDRIKQLNQYSNPSRTGPYVAMTSTLGALYAAPLPTIAGLVGGKVMAHILAQPTTARALRDWMKAYYFAAKFKTRGASNMLMQSSKALSLGIGRELRAPEAIPRLTQEIQGISPTQAEPDQSQAPGITH